MPIFAPVYRVDRRSESQLARQDRVRKRKRDQDDDDNDPELEHEHEPGLFQSNGAREISSSFSRPLTRKDPYHIAGWSREDPLPPPPFPHAAVREKSRESQATVEEQLATLKPPLYISSHDLGEDDHTTSLRKRHLNNLTTVLHSCMLKGDWHRAYRAWALILRTEIRGRGTQIRLHGRWSLGAEILMHQSRTSGTQIFNESVDWTAEGFKLAREYYDRLILQYPHTSRAPHGVNSLVIYPALFNIWVYEVQGRSKWRRQEQQHQPQSGKHPPSSDSASSDGDSNSEPLSAKHEALRAIRQQELEEALPIAQRMDELLLGPPYESSTPLLELRGMVALWIADLYAELNEPIRHKLEDSSESGSSPNPQYRNLSLDRPQSEAVNAAREKAKQMFERVTATGVRLPSAVERYV